MSVNRETLNKDIRSVDEIMDALYGKLGTPRREEFRREAKA